MDVKEVSSPPSRGSHRPSTMDKSVDSAAYVRAGKRKRYDKSADDDLDELAPSVKTKRSKPEHQISRFFACPFSKHDPKKHQPCLKYHLSRIRDVKTHLKRKHTVAYFCHRCLTVFPVEEDLTKHLSLPGDALCTKSPPEATLEGLSEAQIKRLSRTSSKWHSEAQGWFVVWDIVFPHSQRPLSPYLEPEPSEELGMFRDFCRKHGQAVMASRISADFPEYHEDKGAFVAMSKAVDFLFDEWIMRGNEDFNNPDHGVSDMSAADSAIGSMSTLVVDDNSSIKVERRDPEWKDDEPIQWPKLDGWYDFDMNLWTSQPLFGEPEPETQKPIRQSSSSLHKSDFAPTSISGPSRIAGSRDGILGTEDDSLGIAHDKRRIPGESKSNQSQLVTVVHEENRGSPLRIHTDTMEACDEQEKDSDCIISAGENQGPTDPCEQDLSMSDSLDLTDSSCDSDWLISSPQEPQPLAFDSPTRAALDVAVIRLVSDFRSAVGGTDPAHRHVGRGTLLSSSASSAGTSSSSTRTKKRKRCSNNSAESDEEGSGRQPVRTPKSALPSGRPFACPLYKAAPERFARCLNYTLNRIGDVKQHLRRKHKRLPFFCRRCLALFPSETLLQEHTPQNVYHCLETPPNQQISPLEGYSESVGLQLAKKADLTQEEAEPWFVVWDLLFPGYSRPRSPFLDPGLTREVSLLRDFVAMHGRSMMQEHLSANGQGLVPEEAMDQAVEHMIRECCAALFSRPTTTSPQQSRASTSQSTNLDLSNGETPFGEPVLSRASSKALSAHATSNNQIEARLQQLGTAPQQPESSAELENTNEDLLPPPRNEIQHMGATNFPGSVSHGNLSTLFFTHTEEEAMEAPEVVSNDNSFVYLGLQDVENTNAVWDEFQGTDSIDGNILSESR